MLSSIIGVVKTLQGGAGGHGLGVVDLDLGHSTTCPSAWTDGSLAELAVQFGNMVEHLNQSQPNPGPRPPATLCRGEMERDSRG